ncbi:hypothetical protein T05_478 [Trichinella murrelli]|uniref:Uncharacterized protein n=1 Tax=Trichinella murrelli TaxID=144512 RepID=A0A0V0TG75_9BILA|nr:hypothetical protein T05_478 [Trichinella murrelli]
MGRDDAIDLLCRSAPLYAFSPANVNLQTFATDSGLGSNNSRTAFDTPTHCIDGVARSARVKISNGMITRSVRSLILVEPAQSS